MECEPSMYNKGLDSKVPEDYLQLLLLLCSWHWQDG